MVKRALAAVAMGIGIVAALATVGSFFGGIWWGLDLLANYRWQMMWAALLASVIYALAGRGLFTAVFIVAAAINLWLILPSWTGNQPAASGEGTVRVTHADLSGTLDDAEGAVMWLVDTDADLLLVAGATSDTIDAISAAASAYEMLTGSDPAPGVVAFAKGDWRITTAFSLSGDPVHRITVPSETGVIDVVTSWGVMATSQTTSDALEARFATIADTVTSSAGPIAVIGDLGATKWSVVSRRLLNGTVLRDATTGSGYLPTWPTSELPIFGPWIGIPIDVAYLSPDLTPLDVVVGPDIGADHLPLVIDISPVGP
jgi:endonuclease/exonuclease/phosphatase (EEP) superfamily protein YafD